MINTGSMTTDLLLQDPAARIWFGIIAFAFGTVFGSFINCMAWRLVHGESVLHGRSHCAVCGHPLGAADLVPVFSWLFLRGRCRYCGEKISPRYMAAELIEGSGFLVCYLRWGLSVDALRWMAMLVVFLGLSLVDLESYEIPDRFIVAALVIWAATMPFVHTWYAGNPAAAGNLFAGLSAGGIGVSQAAPGEAGMLAPQTSPGEAGMLVSPVSAGAAAVGRTALQSLIGGIVIGGGMLLISLVFDKVSGKESLGGGDVKLFFIAGLFLGAANGLLCIILSCIIGLIFAGVFRKQRIPFGPSISLAVFLCALSGNHIVEWYLGLF